MDSDRIGLIDQSIHSVIEQIDDGKSVCSFPELMTQLLPQQLLHAVSTTTTATGVDGGHGTRLIRSNRRRRRKRDNDGLWFVCANSFAFFLVMCTISYGMANIVKCCVIAAMAVFSGGLLLILVFGGEVPR